jgi:hypothetical protein
MFSQAISLDNTFKRSHMTDTALLYNVENVYFYEILQVMTGKRIKTHGSFNNNMINISLLHHPTSLHSHFFHQRFFTICGSYKKYHISAVKRLRQRTARARDI